MHWLWRSVIGIFVGTIVFMIVLPFLIVGSPLHSLLHQHLSVELELWLIVVLPCLSAALLVYGQLTRDFAPGRARSRETLCRKCGYILRGISEPRCPECGERI